MCCCQRQQLQNETLAGPCSTAGLSTPRSRNKLKSTSTHNTECTEPCTSQTPTTLVATQCMHTTMHAHTKYTNTQFVSHIVEGCKHTTNARSISAPVRACASALTTAASCCSCCAWCCVQTQPTACRHCSPSPPAAATAATTQTCQLMNADKDTILTSAAQLAQLQRVSSFRFSH